MEHMKQLQKGVRLTSTKSWRGWLFNLTQQLAQAAATGYDMATPKQEPDNQKTHSIYVIVEKAEGFIVSKQTGMSPRSSNRGMTIYVRVLHLKFQLHQKHPLEK